MTITVQLSPLLVLAGAALVGAFVGLFLGCRLDARVGAALATHLSRAAARRRETDADRPARRAAVPDVPPPRTDVLGEHHLDP